MSDTANFKHYISDLKPIWCPGCGDFGVLTAIAKSFAELRLDTKDIAVISGIGCSSRLPGYLNTYGFNGIHGRAIPVATGLKVARPELSVVVVGGDGDAFSIGGGHLSHVTRRNIDMTYIVMDNSIYGLTKGQVSPTTPIGDRTSTTVYGSVDEPIRPLNLMIGYDASFIAQTSSIDPKHMTEIIVAAMKHRGFSFVNVLSPCVTYRGKDTYDEIRKRAKYIDPKHDASNSKAAWDLITDGDSYPMGVIYRSNRQTYDEKIAKLRDLARNGRVHSVDDEIKFFYS